MVKQQELEKFVANYQKQLKAFGIFQRLFYFAFYLTFILWLVIVSILKRNAYDLI